MRELTEAELRVVVSHLPDFVVVLDEEGRYSWVNRLDPSLREEDVIGKRIDEYVIVPEEKLEILECARGALHKGVPGEMVTLGYREGEYETWYWLRILPLPPDEQGRKRAVLVSRDETRSVQSQRALARSEERFRRLVESSPDFIVILDSERRIVYANKLISGLGEGEVVGQRFDTLVDEASRDNAVATVVRVLESGEPAVYESSAAAAAGAGRRYRVQVVPWTSDGGSKQVLLVASDVTEEYRAAEQRRALLAELDHRVKNTLAVVSALAAQTARHSDSLASFEEAFGGRLRSLAATHEALAAAGWSALGATEIVSKVVVPLAGPQLAVALPDDLDIPGWSVTAVSLAFHELTTNASKHGALASPGGSVRIEGSTGDDEDTLTWTERGVAGPQRDVEGFGLRLVRRLVEQELGGRLELTLLEDGRRYQLHLPHRRER